MARRTKIKQYGQGGKTRGRHKSMWSRETKRWLKLFAARPTQKKDA